MCAIYQFTGVVSFDPITSGVPNGGDAREDEVRSIECASSL